MTRTGRYWPVLVVDDDADVHAVTRLVLGDFRFQGRELDLVSAHSAAEARRLLDERQDFALAMLDVVMETDHAGLDLVKHIRETLGNHRVRIVLRTGQPGRAPEARVVSEYDIDGYHSKTGTTAQHLRTAVTTALRTYSLLNELEARERELRLSNRELERFAFAASHDLQTPLRNISRLAGLLVRKAADRLDEDARELLTMLSDNASILHRLIDDLLDYARIGAPDPKMGPVALDEVLARSLALLQAVIDDRAAVIDAESLPTVEGNADQLERLLRNLLDNAIKYQPGPNPKVEVRCDSGAGGWRLRVIDHGIGIPEEHRESVVQMFKRLHPPDAYPGSGLGLAMCWRIAEVHDGHIEIAETPGGGTTVSVFLPLRQPVG